ncbi:MAG: ATP-NAD kinase family protein [Candidatus Abyssubacteria bacterium]
MKKLGVIVNPVAGMGGRVGLKGSDGPEVLRRARELGAQPQSPSRAVEALKVVSRLKDSLKVIAYPAEMGEYECLEAGLRPAVIGSIRSAETTPQDTQKAAREMAAENVDLILFAGGDGTARDICDAIGQTTPALGIPAGVKIHSGVYAVTPGSAGEVAAMFLEGKLRNTREAEVMDIDEDAFRNGVLTAKLYGYLLIPEEKRFVQNVKSGAARAEAQSLQAIAADVIAGMNEDHYYIIGPGTTTRAIMDRLGLKNTLLGVDLIRNKELVTNDATERQLLDLIQGEKAKIVVTAIGGQGHLFGRGNQQISPSVIRMVGKKNIIVIATKEKLISLSGRPLLVDTGDEQLNQELTGYVRVTTGFRDYVMYKVGF